MAIHLTSEGRRLVESVMAGHVAAIVEELAVLTAPNKISWAGFANEPGLDGRCRSVLEMRAPVRPVDAPRGATYRLRWAAREHWARAARRAAPCPS